MINPAHWQIGMIVGLINRRHRWHIAEYKRIEASLDLFTGPDMEQRASEAMLMHKVALIELNALKHMIEPDWGGEREITERFLEEEETCEKEKAPDRTSQEN